MSTNSTPLGIENTASSVHSSYEAANAALEHIREWAKWMAGIQTAAIGGLAVTVSHSGHEKLPALGPSRPLAMLAFLFLALALFFSAWVLSAVGSIALRLGVHSTDTTISSSLDIYNWPSFTLPFGKLRLGVLMGLQHWSWGIGLMFLSLFAFCYFGQWS